MSTAAQEEEVDDYMSDTFVPQELNDIRPSLLYSHSLRVKQAALTKKSASDPKPKTYYRQLEDRLREEALNTPLDETNKGFKMLAKMGLNLPQSSGQSLPPQPQQPQSSVNESAGADSATGAATDAIAGDHTIAAKDWKSWEPIRIELKNDRKGLGAVKRRVADDDKPQVRHIDDKRVEDQFRTHKRSRNVLFLMSKDLRTAQKVCRNLDAESGVEEQEFLAQTERPKWFWPPIERQSADDGEGVVEQEVAEDGDEEEGCVEQRFKAINEYLRQKYFYCIWCGIQFNDSQDMSDNCLGDTRDDHQ